MTDTMRSNADPSSVHCLTGADGSLIVRMVGEIDISVWPQLEGAFARVTAGPPCAVRVDLSETNFIDSTTLGFLVRMDRHVAEAGHQLVLHAPNRTVLRALQVSGLDQLLTIRPAEA